MNNCIFCKIVKGEIPSKKIYEDEDILVIMDTDPKVDGHALVIPKKHYTDFKELDDGITNKMMNVVKKVTPKMMERLEATGLTMAVNYGASQAVKHFHLHLLPNYLIKEKSLDIDVVYDKLKDIQQEL